MAGLALALGLACGGLWLVRRRLQTAAVKSLLIGGIVLGSLGAFVWADVPSPRPRPAPLPLPPAKSMQLEQVAVEVVEQGETVKLIVNRIDWMNLNLNLNLNRR
jgi:hypothetical protein